MIPFSVNRATCVISSQLTDRMQTDLYQLHNIYPSAEVAETPRPSDIDPTILDLPLSKVVPRLDALLLVLKSCKGSSCTRPWHVLHPEGNVVNLKDALGSAFDTFYEKEQSKVGFTRCEPGQIIDAEGPQHALVFRDGLRWSEWT